MNRVVAITGAAGVLCSEFARHLYKQGYYVALLDLNLEKAEILQKELGERSIAVETNVLDKESLIQAKKQINNTFGKVNYLINGAGGNHPKGTTANEYHMPTMEAIHDFFELDQAGIEFVFNLNFIGTLLPTQIFSKDMVEVDDASIINVSSMSSYHPLTKIPAYSGAKAAINNFTKWLAVYFSRTNIRVNAIAPGFFETNQNKTLLRKEDGSLSERASKIIDATPLQRFGEPKELLGTIDFLLSKKASGFITGIIIPIDGGFSAYSGV